MLARASATCAIQAGQGFGDPSKHTRSTPKGGKGRKEAGIKSGDAKAVQRAVRLVERQEGAARPPAARPVDPREAARGKVEYVKVKDWGSGAPEDLGALQVAQEGHAVEAQDGEGAGGQPFHEALARRLELLQTQGALGVAQPQGAKPLPEFQRWAFAPQHYAQYLADMHAVHVALEASVAAATAQAAEAEYSERLAEALALFGRDQGLGRADALLRDLRALDARDRQQGQQGPAGSSEDAGGSTTDGGAGGEHSPPPATQHAAAYAAYLASLARACRAAEGRQELEEAALRLLANAYVIHLMHLTSGGRIAAAAAQRLDLAAAGALAFHSSYPQLDARAGPGAKPLAVFVSDVNALGELLSGGQREGLMAELGKATTKTSMLLAPLAREA